MIIQHFAFEPFLIDSRIFRKGLLLTMAASNGRETTVEVSPLPGYSVETFDDAKAQLSQIKRRIMATWWSQASLSTLSQMDLHSSVHFALETAMLNLLDPCVPTSEVKEEVKSYSLLIGTPDEILFSASKLKMEGQTEIKIKLGHMSPSDAHAVIDTLKDHFRIRIDFNRKWRSEDTIAFCERYPVDQFVYMEEPCQNSSELLHFPYPFALDESLRDGSYPSLLRGAHLKALILKPTLHYPLTHFLQLGIPCVMTSCFESAVGIQQIRCLIKRLGLEKTYHGLDTLRYIDKNDEMPHRRSIGSSR